MSRIRIPTTINEAETIIALAPRPNVISAFDMLKMHKGFMQKEEIVQKIVSGSGIGIESSSRSAHECLSCNRDAQEGYPLVPAPPYSPILNSID